MNKKEVLEIRKLLNKDRCRIERICGCYVDGHKEKKLEMKEAFLSLPEEEMFKYIDIFKRTLSGTIGKNLLNLEFPPGGRAGGRPAETAARSPGQRSSGSGAAGRILRSDHQHLSVPGKLSDPAGLRGLRYPLPDLRRPGDGRRFGLHVPVRALQHLPRSSFQAGALL